MGFPKGVSGNPGGRPRRLLELEAQIRDAHGPAVVDVLAKVRELALAGDVHAAKLFLERLMGPARAPAEPLPLPTATPGDTAPGAHPAQELLPRVVALIARQVAALEAQADADGLTDEDAAALARCLAAVTATAQAEGAIILSAQKWAERIPGELKAEVARVLGLRAEAVGVADATDG